MNKDQLKQTRSNIRRYHVVEREYRRLTEELGDSPNDGLSLSGIANGLPSLHVKGAHDLRVRYEKMLHEVISIYSWAVEEHENMRDVAILTGFVDGGMTVDEVAKHLSVGRTTIYRALNEIIEGYHRSH